jgi:hypothetical protein
MNKTFLLLSFFPLLNINIAAGIQVQKNRFAGSHITASSKFSSIIACLIFHSLAHLNNTPCGTTTHTFQVQSYVVSIICDIKAQSHLLFGGTHLQNLLYLSHEALSAPHLSKENGGFATTVSNFISVSHSFSFGLFKVSPQRIVALSNQCKNIFITARAQVLQLFSCQKSAKLFVQTSLHAFISNEPDQQVGSNIRAHGLLFVSLASSVDTSDGV